jgi:V8-like Glu-specific endopeptidase
MRWLIGSLALLSLVPFAPAQSGTDAYKATVKSTVWIHSERGRRGLATGSGSLIDKSARLVLTNYHVVGDTKRATVFFPAYKDDKPIPEKAYYKERTRTLGIDAEVIEIDRNADLAVLKLERIPAGAPELPLANGSADPGQQIHSVGNPGGSGALWVYTPGKVEGKIVTFKAKVVETDSPTNPGDSGGPLVNDKAELVGVTQGGAANAQLISTFVDLSEVKRILARDAIAKLRTKAERGTTKNDPPAKPRTGVAESKDAAKLFSAEAWGEFEKLVKRLHDERKTDFAIETFATPPGSTAETVRKMEPKERFAFFREAATKRIATGQIDGVYILVCKSPGFAFVAVTRDAVSAFPDGFSKKVEEAMLTAFKKEKFDDGLREAMTLVAEGRALGEKK